MDISADRHLLATSMGAGRLFTGLFPWTRDGPTSSYMLPHHLGSWRNRSVSARRADFTIRIIGPFDLKDALVEGFVTTAMPILR
jgi:hypothetical protein